MNLWRAVDCEDEVLDVLVQSSRNKRAAMKLMRKLLNSLRLLSNRNRDRQTAIVWRGSE
jgi:putative transposase